MQVVLQYLTYFTSIVLIILWYWHKNGCKDQQSRIEGSEIKWQNYVLCIFDRKEVWVASKNTHQKKKHIQQNMQAIMDLYLQNEITSLSSN